MITKEQIELLSQKIIELKPTILNQISEGLDVSSKQDGSKVTNLDLYLDKEIIRIIKEDVKSNCIIISEEAVEDGQNTEIIDGENFWSIDPIDSTKSLIAGSPMYCISIAYVSKNVPIFGLIYAPSLDTAWLGSSLIGGTFKQVGSERQQVFCREIPKDGAILMSSEEQVTPQDVLDKYNIKEDLKVPSAIKFAYLAEGKADYYFRKRNKACDWDIAAGQALISSAGGSVQYLDPANFLYGKPPYKAPSLVAKGKV